MLKTSEQMVLQGLPVSEGIAIGAVLFLEEKSEDCFPVFPITAAQVAEEIHRYRRAIHSSRKDLEKLQYSLAKEGSKEAVTIINAHIQMLEDPIMTTVMEEKIGVMLHNTEHVFRTVIADYERQFQTIEDEFFRQRFTDVKDLSNRILSHLHPISKDVVPEVPSLLVFAYELVPSLTAESSANAILGFVTQSGGGTSHAALIAKAKGIPYISHIEIDAVREFAGATAIIDGYTGEVILNPSDTVLDYYHKKMQAPDKQEEIHPIRVQTQDGTYVDVWANIEDLNDLSLLNSMNIGGIGLLRSEFLSSKNDIESLTEEDQVVLYQQMVKNAGGLPLYFRVFDVGGDKNFSSSLPIGQNPALGCRSLRFLLRYPDVFIKQIRALLRASAETDVYMLLPLVTDCQELVEAKQIIYTAKEQLVLEGYLVSKKLLIGSMIEIPSAVMVSDQIAKESDFFSIGTNDLVQYTLAADRSSSDLYRPTHPSILRMIRLVLDNARRYNIPVSICGEIASNALFIPLLLGLGIRHFSCPLRYIPLIKSRLSGLSLKETEDIAATALTYTSTAEVDRLLTDAYVRS